MAKWYGQIGYVETVETEPGLWEEQITERSYYGDLVSNRWKRQSSGSINDDVNIANDISIVADPYANEHCSSMAYVEFMGTKWKISNVEVQYPRLILTIGGVYNENQATVTE